MAGGTGPENLGADAERTKADGRTCRGSEGTLGADERTAQDGRDLWVFGYGSLMWRPGFDFAEARRAHLAGFHRALCIYSVHWRGSPRRPGLVLGLARSGSCEGIAYRVPAEVARNALTYLRERELIYGVYREAMLPVTLAPLQPGPCVRNGDQVMALAYVAEKCHPSFAGGLSVARTARIVRAAAGAGGTNLDYLASTLCWLGRLGIREPSLERVAVAAGAFALKAVAADELRSRPLGVSRAAALRPAATPAKPARDRQRFQHRRASLPPTSGK